jgi:hypothetical protein
MIEFCHLFVIQVRNTRMQNTTYRFGYGTKLGYLIAVLITFLAACTSSQPRIVPAVPADFTIQINRPFTSLPNYTRLYFQDGKQQAYTALDQWKTWCQLRVFNPDKQADYLTSIAPGNIGITKVFNRLESSEGSSTGLVSFGAMGSGSFGVASSTGLDRDPPSYYLYRVIMKLDSPGQPDVRSLSCAQKWGSRGNHYPDLTEIRHALGEQIYIQAPSN